MYSSHFAKCHLGISNSLISNHDMQAGTMNMWTYMTHYRWAQITKRDKQT